MGSSEVIGNAAAREGLGRDAEMLASLFSFKFRNGDSPDPNTIIALLAFP